jgi:hypothetical protein
LTREDKTRVEEIYRSRPFEYKEQEIARECGK